MSKVNTFTSTGLKLIHHPEAIEAMQRKCGYPLSLQIAPTSRCNLNCVFCSNINRDKDEALDPVKIKNLLADMRSSGAKTVEWTGGGDPTLYRWINDVVEFAHIIGFEQGFITNGINIDKIVSVLHMLKWVRISMNCLDYVDKINIPKMDEDETTLGFSYVWNEKTTPDTLSRLQEHVGAYHPSYVRIVPNCQATHEEQHAHNSELSAKVAAWGSPYFYQVKEFRRPDRCWLGYIKPFVLHDGYVYPCSSVVLNSGSGRKFHERYRWVEMERLPDMYLHDMEPLDTTNCDHCVFHDQNDQLDDLIYPNKMKNFY